MRFALALAAFLATALLVLWLREDMVAVTPAPRPAAVQPQLPGNGIVSGAAPGDPAMSPPAAAKSAGTAARAPANAPAGMPPVTLPTAAAPPDPTTTAPPLQLPVQGISPEQLHDTFSDARSEGRLHDAIDIMAPAGTPVLAVADGTVEKLFDSQRGGLTLYQFGPGGRLAYYYAHLQRYADGLAEGQPLRRGQVIGYVGSTGNASADAPHLHFAIFVLGPERRWWEGEAVNPYPILRGEVPLP